MQVTARSDYAVRACLELAARHGGGPVKADQMAQAQGIPPKFLESILLLLRKDGVVGSRRGTEGGYWLARPPSEVTVADVVRAVEGPLAAVRGELPETVSYEGAAGELNQVWVAVRAALRSVLETVTLADVVAGALPDPVRRLVDDPRAWRSRWSAPAEVGPEADDDTWVAPHEVG